jgi:CBS domain-containing protein
MSAPARDWRLPLTVFGGFRKDEQGRVDLKKRGLMQIFTSARTCAIKHGVRERSTAARLRAAGNRAGVPSENIEAIISGHRVLLRVILEQQLIDTERGVPVSNSVEIKRLSAFQRKELHDALMAINLLRLVSL